MPHFYFHFRLDGKLAIDDEGQDLPDLSAAKREAQLSAREILADAIQSGKDQVPDAIVIADEHGREIDTFLLGTILPNDLKR